MKGLTNLENRIEVLERPNKSGLDPLVLILGRLNDAERGLLTEYRSLLGAGFSTEEIPEMMGYEAYKEFVRISWEVQAELDKSEQPELPKRRGKPLKLPKEACYGDSGADSSCAESD